MLFLPSNIRSQLNGYNKRFLISDSEFDSRWTCQFQLQQRREVAETQQFTKLPDVAKASIRSNRIATDFLFLISQICCIISIVARQYAEQQSSLKTDDVEDFFHSWLSLFPFTLAMRDFKTHDSKHLIFLDMVISHASHLKKKHEARLVFTIFGKQLRGRALVLGTSGRDFEIHLSDHFLISIELQCRVLNSTSLSKREGPS